MNESIRQYKTRTAVLIIGVLCIILFANTLGNSFMWDEKVLIEDNYHIKNIKRIGFLFIPEYWQYYHAGTKGQYRPVRSVTFAIDYSFWKISPVGYHITNILLHLINSLLVFTLILSLSGLLGNNQDEKRKKSIALLAALLFVSHPIHTESVTWIKNRSDLLCLMFMLSGLWWFVKFINKKRFVSYLMAIGCFILSIFSKEMGLSLPLILLFLVVCLNNDIVKKEKIKKMLFTVPFFAIGGLFVFFKKAVLGMVVYRDHVQIMGLYSHMLSVVKTIGIYLMLLIWPFKLNAERLFFVPVSIRETAVFLSFFAVILSVFIVFRSFKRSKLMSFSLAWTILAILPAANILFLSSRPIAEQRLYIPSVGFCILLGIGIYHLNNKTKQKFIAGFACFLILASYSYKTICRNQDWVNPLVFWSKTVKDSPLSARAQTNLGNAYVSINDFSKAAAVFKQAIKLDPEHAQAYNNLGNIYVEQVRKIMSSNSGLIQMLQEQLLRALSFFDKAIELDPNNYDAYNNIGAIYDILRDDKKAEKYYEKALSINKYYDKAYLNLGLLYLSRGALDKALEKFKSAIAINPEYAHAYNNLGVVYDNMGMLDEALNAFKRVIELDSGYANAYYNIGYNYIRRNDTENAIRFLLKTKQVDPSHTNAYIALGLLYVKNKEYKKAIQEYEQVLKMEPDTAMVCNNLSFAYFQIQNYEAAVKYNTKAQELGFEVDPGFAAQLEPYKNKGAN